MSGKIVEFYTAVREKSLTKQLRDGSNQPPHYSLRTLCRALIHARAVAPSIGMIPALYTACACPFSRSWTKHRTKSRTTCVGRRCWADRSWRCGHRDIDVDGEPHSVLMVTLVKTESTPLEHRYADEFLSPTEFQWESQDKTTLKSAKGRRILHHAKEGRRIHLFVRYNPKTPEGMGEPFTYCGTVTYDRHEGEEPIRVWFRMDEPLPKRLFHAWVR